MERKGRAPRRSGRRGRRPARLAMAPRARSRSSWPSRADERRRRSWRSGTPVRWRAAGRRAGTRERPARWRRPPCGPPRRRAWPRDERGPRELPARGAPSAVPRVPLRTGTPATPRAGPTARVPRAEGLRRKPASGRRPTPAGGPNTRPMRRRRAPGARKGAGQDTASSTEAFIARMDATATRGAAASSPHIVAQTQAWRRLAMAAAEVRATSGAAAGRTVIGLRPAILRGAAHGCADLVGRVCPSRSTDGLENAVMEGSEDPNAAEDARRAAIKAAAREVPAERAYRRTSMPVVAERARASDRTMYWRYGSEEALVAALIHRDADEAARSLEGRGRAASADARVRHGAAARPDRRARRRAEPGRRGRCERDRGARP